jgi:hypothetical protein
MRLSKRALDARARRAAKRIGLIVRKSRWRAGSTDNFGEFMLIEPERNVIVGGERFNMSAEEVIVRCTNA